MPVLVALLILLLSLVLLALVARRVLGQVASLGRTVSNASQRLAAASEGLERRDEDEGW